MSNYDDWKDPDEIDLTGSENNSEDNVKTSQGGNSQPNNQESEEDKPIHLNKKKSGWIVAALIMILIISILFFRRCSVSKEVNSPQNNQTQEVVEEEYNQNESITIETESESNENSSDSDELDTSLDQNSNSDVQNDSSSQSQELEQQSQQGKDSDIQNTADTSKNNVSNSSDGISITEVNEPVLSDVIESSGMVSSKDIYLSNGGSYVYSINLLVLQGDDSYSTVEYFCPKTTYDAVTTGDTLIVTYQSDSNGNISISSVAR